VSGATLPTRRFAGDDLFWVLGGLLVVFLLYPFLAFFLRIEDVDPAAFTTPDLVSAVRYSLTTAPVATAIASVLGVPLAYVLARRDFRGKLLVDAFVVLPLVIPPVVGGTMLLAGFGTFTPVGQLAATVGIRLTDSYWGIVIAQTFVAAPFVVITARAGFDGIDRNVERAARSLGKGPLETFLRISLPLAKGSILAGVVLTFARAMGEFGATMMTAYHPRTMPVQIWVDFIGHGIDATFPLAAILVTVGFVVVLGVRYFGHQFAVSS
jgi:molybdate/tungstate transport system permease protein